MTQAFPLQWPLGRPRTKSRTKSSFKVTAGKAYTELMQELSRFNVANPVVSSNAPLSQKGTPYADALNDPLPDSGVAVYFTRKKRLVCLACDTYKLPLENIRAISLSIKALRDMDRWGAGQVLDQAFEGFTALAPPDQMSEPQDGAWWLVVGCKPDASDDEINAAYKTAVRQAGGATVELNAAKEAGLAVRGAK